MVTRVQSLTSFDTPAEAVSFDYFRAHTVESITGMVTSSFWDKLVLQASHSNPVIRQAVVALGTLTRLDATPQTSIEGIQQYNKAINLSLREPQPVDITLLSCILFMVLELLLGNKGNAFAHLGNGLMLLGSQFQPPEAHGLDKSPWENCQIDEAIWHAFIRYDIHASSVDRDRPPMIRCWQWESLLDTILGLRPVQEYFTINEIQAALHHELLRCYHFLRAKADLHRYRSEKEVPLETFGRQQYIIGRLELWEASFRRCLQRQGQNLSTKCLKTALLLKISYATMYIIVSTSLVTEEMPYDKYVEHFKKILTWIKSLHPSYDKGKDLDPPPPATFSSEMGIIQPLKFLATKCRDPVVRKEAVHLLSDPLWIEGILDSGFCARICQHIVQLEEEGLREVRSSSDIPECRRVHGYDVVTVGEGGRSIMVETKFRPNGIDGGFMSRINLVAW
ncbi:hypothetical protein MMC06_004673 [Schaereria dolodes]|nr:hypothetical protein [Schaereria dolodes]